MFYDFMDWFLEHILLPLMFIFIFLMVVVWLPVGIYLFVTQQSHCSEWQQKIVHQEAYTSYVFSGKVMVPIYNPPRDVQQNVCVKPK